MILLRQLEEFWDALYEHAKKRHIMACCGNVTSMSKTVPVETHKYSCEPGVCRAHFLNLVCPFEVKKFMKGRDKSEWEEKGLVRTHIGPVGLHLAGLVRPVG